MASLLIVEDDPVTARIITACLSGHDTFAAATLAEARKMMGTKRFDMILFDLELPDGNALDYCREELAHSGSSSVPFLFLTGNKGLNEKIMGFSVGAEDYVTKPFEPAELRARIDARLAKLQVGREAAERVALDGMVLHVPEQRVYIADTSSGTGATLPVELTSLEFRILLHMVRHRDHVHTRDQLMTAVWGPSVHVLERTVDSHVSNLRKKLKNSPWLISSVYGSGYRLERSKNRVKSAA